VRLACPKRPKIVCSPSYTDIRSRANTTRGLDFNHMINREHTRKVKHPKNYIAFVALNAEKLKQIF
jgi:hypothetical protein